MSSASPVQLTNAVGMTSVVPCPVTRSHGGLVGSQAVYPRASNVERMPPDGKLEASGSPLTSSLPLNSATARPSGVGFRNESCFSAVMPGHRLEPMRVVGRAVIDGPVLQRAGDRVGNRRIEGLALGDRPAQRTEHVLGQPRALNFFIERQRSVFLRRLSLRRRGGPAAGYSPFVDPRIASLDDAEPIVDVLSSRARSWRRAADVKRSIMRGAAARRKTKTRSTPVSHIYMLNIVIHINDYYAPILGEFEQLVLLALLRLGNGAYGAAHPPRNPRADRPRGRDRGALHDAWPPRAKKMVCAYIGVPTNERGGRRRKHYLLDTDGKRALGRAYRTLRTMAQGLESELERYSSAVASACGTHRMCTRADLRINVHRNQERTDALLQGIRHSGVEHADG